MRILKVSNVQHVGSYSEEVCSGLSSYSRFLSEVLLYATGPGLVHGNQLAPCSLLLGPGSVDQHVFTLNSTLADLLHFMFRSDTSPVTSFFVHWMCYALRLHSPAPLQCAAAIQTATVQHEGSRRCNLEEPLVTGLLTCPPPTSNIVHCKHRSTNLYVNISVNTGRSSSPN